MSKYLISKELMREYLSKRDGEFNVRELEGELETERLDAIRQTVFNNISTIKAKMLDILKNSEREDCTATINENLSNIEEPATDIRKRTLNNIFGKYIKNEIHQNEENLFTEYMKKQVCADLPEAGKLIDLVYQKCQNVKLSDRLNAINDVLYKTFLEYLGTVNLVLPNNRKDRILSERISSYRQYDIGRTPALCMKNTLKKDNTVVSCISYPDNPGLCGYIVMHPWTALNIPRFVNYILNEDSDPVIEGEIKVKLCELPEFRQISFFIQNYSGSRSFESCMRGLGIADRVEPDKVYTYMAMNLTGTDYNAKVGIKKFREGVDGYIADSDLRMSVDTLLDTSDVPVEFAAVSEELSTELNDLFHSLIRKDHALEDILNLFMQFLSIENIADIYTESRGNVYFLGHPEESVVRSNITKAIMAAIIAPVKRSTSGFNVAPDLSLVAKIAGLDEITVAHALYRFSTAFGLEFFASETAPSGIPIFINSRHKSVLGDSSLFHFPVFSESRVLRPDDTDRSYLDIIRPRLKKLVATKIASNRNTIDSERELIYALHLTVNEYICLSNYFLTHTIRPAISFYMSIVSTINYIIGHKAASMGIYLLNIYQENTSRNMDPNVNSIVYGMGPGLIHAVFRSPKTNDNYYPDVAVPVSQYIMTNMAISNSRNLEKISVYVGNLMGGIKMFEYYLKRAGRLVKSAARTSSYIRENGEELLSNINSLPDFKNIRTLYISDPDNINVFAPAFRGVFKSGDRARLESMFAEARKKLEDNYYVIAGRRPLVPEETLEDAKHSITLATDSDRLNIKTFMNAMLYASTVSDGLDISSSRALSNPDISVISLDARALALNTPEETSDDRYTLDLKRCGLILSFSASSFDLLSNEVFIGCDYPGPLRKKLLPSLKNLRLKDGRRGCKALGLFTESNRWGLAHKYADRYNLSSTFPQLYQVTDKRASGNRIPILAIPEKSGQGMIDTLSNAIFNTTSDNLFSEDGNDTSFASNKSEIPNKILRMIADVNFLPPYTNYRFVEAERRRWSKQKYPKYKASMYTRFVKSPSNSSYIISGPYDTPDRWDIQGPCSVLQACNLNISFHNNGNIGSSEKDMEKKRKELLLAAETGKKKEDNIRKSWSQLWLENVLKQLNGVTSDNNRPSNVDPYAFQDEYVRQIVLSLMPEYRNNENIGVVQTLVDTEDISKSLNIYMELIDPEEIKEVNIKARMRVLALMTLGMTSPCNQEFLDAVDAEDTPEPENTSVLIDNKVQEKYRPRCKSRELTEIAAEIRVKAVKNKISNEMRELRRQKEEYCRKYREYMSNLKKQRKSMLDNRCFLNNKNIFTEEEKGIESLYNNGKILGYKLVLRDPYINDTNSSEGRSVLLDMNEYTKEKDRILNRISSGDSAIDLLALTAPVYIWSGAFIFSIGKVTINIRDVFNSVNTKPKFYNEDASIQDKYIKAGLSMEDLPSSIVGLRMDAPHVREHRACLGNLERNLNSASTEEDVLAYLEWCLQYLNTVNLGDTYGACLSYFPCVPATMHNVIKYGVLASGRLDDKICLWTGARSKNEPVSPYSDIVVQPVWNIRDDLARALYEDAMQKIENDMFEGSDITEGHLEEIVKELFGDASAGWFEGNNVLRSVLSYSLCKESQDEEPDYTIGSSGHYLVSDHNRFSSTVRAGIRQKLEHREVFMNNSIKLLRHTFEHGISFSDIWKPGMRKDLQIGLETVRNNRLQNYCINI